VGGGLVRLDYGDVVRLLGLDQPADVRLDRVQGVEGHRDTGQVQRREQRLEVPGYVRLRTDLHLGERIGEVFTVGPPRATERPRRILTGPEPASEL
jgi:hypothetical protein